LTFNKSLKLKKKQNKAFVEIESNTGGKEELQANVALIATGRKPLIKA